MPVGIVAGAKDVVVNLVVGQYVRDMLVLAGLFGVGEVDDDLYVFGNFADGAAAGVHKLADVHPVFFAGHAGCRFVSDLNHADGGAAFKNFF